MSHREFVDSLADALAADLESKAARSARWTPRYPSVVEGWPSVIEAIGHTGVYDYVEFVGEYGPYDLHDLDNMCRAAELYDMSMMIKVDQEPRGFLAQRAIGSGFHSILFADCRSAEDVRQCVRAVRPDTPEDGGTYGANQRRFAYMGYGGGADYVQVGSFSGRVFEGEGEVRAQVAACHRPLGGARRSTAVLGGGVGPENAAEHVRRAGAEARLMVLLGSRAYAYPGGVEEGVRAAVEAVRT